MRRWLPLGTTLLALLIASSATAKSGSWRSARDRLRTALEQEIAITETSAQAHRGLAALDRERNSLRYTASILDHASDESMRRLQAYREKLGDRELRARQRARALYKLSRGGVAKLMFDDLRDGSGEARVQRGRALRFLVRHDLERLRVHQRAEQRATAELVSVARERDALAAVTMVEHLHEQALVGLEQGLDPELKQAWSRRRRALNDIDDKALQANRDLLRLVHQNWRELRSLRGLHGSQRLVRPVPGKVVGRFGTYEDRTLRLPMVRHGVELKARAGTQARAMADGQVVLVAELPEMQRVVVLDHGGGQYTLTGRLWSTGVAEGDEVEAGQVLGEVGHKAIDDGLGNTVYVELRHGEKPIDPRPYLRRARPSKAP